MKILFFHPGDYMEATIPPGIALLIALLKRDNHDVALFDTTFVKPRTYSEGHEAGSPTLLKKTEYTIEDLVRDDPVQDPVQEFQKKIDSFKPDLIAVSAMTSNYDYAISLIKKVKKPCPVIFGGVHATISPEEVIGNNVVDMICIGDGDRALVELCMRMELGQDITGVENLWIKTKDGTVIKNKLGTFVDLDDLPCPDWSLFDSRHLFRPFMGKIYKGGFYVSSRGCPGQCTYCVNQTLQGLYKECGKYFRFQKPETTAKHLAEIKNKYGVTWLRFGDDTFLLQPLEQLEKLRDLVKPLNIQFGCSARPNTVTEEKVKIAKEMGCVAISIGIETGNEHLRRTVLNRPISNEQIEKAFRIVDAAGIRISSFNLLGIPGETRENVFETIELNRKLKVSSANAYIVYPFPGTRMAIDYRINNKYRNGKTIPMSKAAVFHLSKMSPTEVKGLLKTFNLYLALPKDLWPVLRRAEYEDKTGKELFQALNNYASHLLESQ